MNQFKQYVIQRGNAEHTAKVRVNHANAFMRWCGQSPMNYETLSAYVMHCKEQGNTSQTIRSKIKSLEYYFDYLSMTENPAKLLRIKGGTRKVVTRLLSSEELNEIYALQTTRGLVQKRNKVLLSLVVFQGIGSAELGRIELNDVDLTEGKIYVPGSRSANGRTLELKAKQLLLFQNYLLNVRPLILQESKTFKGTERAKQSNYFLVHNGPNDNGLMSNVISGILKRLRAEYPKLESLQQVRKSVVSAWVKSFGVRKAQYMAGHRYVSSTERYDQEQLEGLKNELKTHYILGK